MQEKVKVSLRKCTNCIFCLNSFTTDEELPNYRAWLPINVKIEIVVFFQLLFATIIFTNVFRLLLFSWLNFPVNAAASFHVTHGVGFCRTVKQYDLFLFSLHVDARSDQT